MTEKQIETLILFAQNYSLRVIAKKQKVSTSTIRERIKSMLVNHPKEFWNATAVRHAHKRVRDGIRNCEIDTTIVEQY